MPPASTLCTDSQILCLLAWADTQERLDNLILEIRHLQQSLIYFLRSPVLYRPLRFEEGFLFDGSAWEEYSVINVVLSNKIAEQSIIPYPFPRDIQNSNDSNSKSSEYEAIKRHLIQFINKQWHRGRWTTEQQRFYYSLLALQHLKQCVFSDKVLLYGEATRAIKLGDADNQNEQRHLGYGRFHVLRSGISAKIKDYIERLGDFQSQFAKAQDVGLLDHPRPSTERRREQRLFSATMADKCRDLWREIRHLWIYVGKNDKSSSDEIPIPLIFHRWKHFFTSGVDCFSGTDNKQSITIINTSYFMPERPDIKTLTAHEVCHAFLNTVYDDFSPQNISLSNHQFSAVIRRLQQCLEIFSYPENTNTLQFSLTKEIAVDLFTSAVQGVAYLYAIFIELMGSGLEELLRSGATSEIDLSMIDYLDGIGGEYDQFRDWYLRLNLISAWIQVAIPQNGRQPNTIMGERLCAAVIDHCESLTYYLDEIARPGRKSARYWRTLKKRLNQIVIVSEFRESVSTWWKERWRDYYGDNDFGVQMWPLPLRPLPQTSRKFLYSWLWDAREQCVAEHISKEEFFFAMQSLNLPDHSRIPGLWKYQRSGRFKEVSYEAVVGPRSIFEYPEDVPWQLSFILASDLLFPPSNPQSKNISILGKDPNLVKMLIKQLRFLHTLVRVGYQYALEFHLSNTEPPTVKLEDILRVLDSAQMRNNANIKKETIDLIEREIKCWQGYDVANNNANDLRAEIQGIVSKLNDLATIDEIQKACESVSSKFNVESCVAYSNLQSNTVDELEKTILYKIISFKIKALQTIINKILSQKQDILPSFLPLKKNIDIIIEKYINNNPDKIYSVLVNAFLQNKSFTPCRPYLNGRVSVGSSYKLFEDSGTNGSIKTEYFINSRLRDDSEGEYYNVVGLIGRYDQFISDQLDREATYNMPRFQSKQEAKIGDKYRELFLPFFVRWEYGIPIRLLNGTPWDTSKSMPIAYISVLLNRASARFDVLYRLLNSINHKTKSSQKFTAYPKNIEELSSFFRPRDYAFLSDGWEDIVLVICGTPNDVWRVFHIQDALYHDYLVTRTEMNLSLAALDYMLVNPEGVRFRVLYRLVDEGNLFASNEVFRGNLENRLNKVIGHEVAPFSATLTKTPGRMDFSLRLWRQHDCCTKKEENPNGECKYALPHSKTSGSNISPCNECYYRHEKFKKLLKKYCTLVDEAGEPKNGSLYNDQIMYKELLKLCAGNRIDRIQTNFGWVEYLPPFNRQKKSLLHEPTNFTADAQ